MIVFYYHIASWKLNNLGKEVLLIILVGISALLELFNILQVMMPWDFYFLKVMNAVQLKAIQII